MSVLNLHSGVLADCHNLLRSGCHNLHPPAKRTILRCSSLLTLITCLLLPLLLLQTSAQIAVRVPDRNLDVTRILYARNTTWLTTPSGVYRLSGSNSTDLHIDLPDVEDIYPEGDGLLLRTILRGFYLYDGTQTRKVSDSTKKLQRLDRNLLITTESGECLIAPDQRQGSPGNYSVYPVEPSRSQVLLDGIDGLFLLNDTTVMQVANAGTHLSGYLEFGSHLWVASAKHDSKELPALLHITGNHISQLGNHWIAKVQKLGTHSWLNLGPDPSEWIRDDGSNRVTIGVDTVRPSLIDTQNSKVWLVADRKLFCSDGKEFSQVHLGSIEATNSVLAGDILWLLGADHSWRIQDTNVVEFPRGDLAEHLVVGTNMWFRGERGLYIAKGTNLNLVVELPARVNLALVKDELWVESAGALLSGTQGAGLYRITENGCVKILDGLEHIEDWAANRDATWITTGTGIYRVKGNEATRVSDPPSRLTWSVGNDRTNQWVIRPDGILQIRGDALVKIRGINVSMEQLYADNLFQELANGTWLATEQGCYLIRGSNSIKVSSLHDLVNGEWVTGNTIWLRGTWNGFRIEGTNVITIGSTNVIFSDREHWGMEFVGNGSMILEASKVFLGTATNRTRLFDDAVRGHWIGLVGSNVWVATSEGAFRVEEDARIEVALEGSASWLQKAVKAVCGKEVWVAGSVKPIARYVSVSGKPCALDGLPMTFRAHCGKEPLDLANWDANDFNSIDAPFALSRSFGREDVWVAVKDKWGNIFRQKCIGFVLPGPALLAIGLPLGWGLVLGTIIALAPFWMFSHRLLMNPNLRGVGYLGSFPALVTTSSFLRSHLLRRYAKGIANDENLTQWRNRFVIPGPEFEVGHFAARLSPRKPLLILGASGCGKSSFLRYFCVADETAQFRRNHLPVLLRLNTLEEAKVSSVDQLFSRELRRYGQMTDEALSAQFLKEGGFLILMDGLNEVDEAKRKAATEFARTNGELNLVCLTSQEAYPECDGLDRVEMKEFPPEKIRDFIQKRLPSRAKEIIPEMTGPLYRLYSNPLELELVLELLRDARELPQNRCDLYDAILTPVFKRWKDSGQGLMEDLLISKAYGFRRERIAFIDPKTSGLGGAMITDLENKKFLVRSGDSYRFRHDLVLGYLAALHIRKDPMLLEEIADKDLDSNWRAVMEFTCLLLNKAERVKGLLLLVLGKNYVLAGDLVTWLEEVRPDLVEGWKTDFDRDYGRKSRKKK